MNTNENTARHNRNKSVGTTKVILDEHGTEVCGDPKCGGEIVQVNESGTRACFKCGKKAT